MVSSVLIVDDDPAFLALAARVLIGTAAYQDVDFLDAAIAEFDDRVVVSVDARGGRLAAAGWTEQTDIPLEAVIEHLNARGVRRFVYSSIDRDGMLEGPDLDGARRVAEAVRGSYVYSGGVSSLDDLRALVELRQVNLSGVIVGKALYEGRFTVADATYRSVFLLGCPRRHATNLATSSSVIVAWPMPTA